MTARGIGVVCAALLACSDWVGEDARGGQLFVEGSRDRTIREIVYDTLWTYGGPEDTLLSAPIRMAAAPTGGVYVLDPGMGKVYHFANGRLMWSWGTQGSGPGEIQNVRAMDADPETGGVVLVDSGNRRIILLSPDGSLLRETRILATSPLFPNVAALGHGLGYVVSTATPASPVMHLTSNGDSAGAIRAPWDGFLSKDFLQVAGSVFAANNGAWGFAFATGNGWFVYSSIDDDAPLAHPYVEHVDFPEVLISESTTGTNMRRSAELVTRPVYSAYELDVRADTLFVLAGASLAREGLDLYTIADGQYVETRTLPGRFTRFALAGDTVFVIDRRGLFPAILSLHPQGEIPQ